MSIGTDLAQRCRLPEIMDDPALDGARHMAALRGLARINRWSGSIRIVWSALREITHAPGPAPLRVLDLATGAGDVPIGLALWARRSGFNVEIDACDASLRALEHARNRATRAGVAVRFFELDALRADLPEGYDVVVSSLFLHHLANDEAVWLLRKMGQRTRRLVVINDLLRSRSGLALAYVGSRILTSSAVVHVDAVRSVRAAFTVDEVRALADAAGLHGATVQRRWPRRFLLTWGR